MSFICWTLICWWRCTDDFTVAGPLNLHFFPLKNYVCSDYSQHLLLLSPDACWALCFLFGLQQLSVLMSANTFHKFCKFFLLSFRLLVTYMDWGWFLYHVVYRHNHNPYYSFTQICLVCFAVFHLILLLTKEEDITVILKCPTICFEQ